MEYPKIIKGVWHSYQIKADISDAEVPIRDIASFRLSHETHRNGLQVEAYIKPELVETLDYSGLKLTGVNKNKYKMSQSHFTIRTKDMPKFRKELYAELMKSPTIIKKAGINAGTPIAQSYEYHYKEIKVEAQ